MWVRRGRWHGKWDRYVCFGSYGRLEIQFAFEDCVLFIQRLKASFVYLLWSETNLWIKDGPSTLIDFIDWVCLR